jgi:pSer/pThr/pTyr-binding forkhead associated (FHA) protein
MVGAVAGEQLRVSEGQDSGQTISVDSEILFGRGSTDELGRLGDDPLLSRRHARIGRGPSGQLIVEDLGSANGTFVNDQRIEGVYTLALGDRVRVGGTVFEVADAGGNVPAKTQLSDSPPPREAAPAAQPAPPPAPAEELLVTGGLSQGKRLGLGDEVVLGRAPTENGGLGEDPGLSRRHARVARDTAGGIVIEDLGSANGTFVNGQRIGEPRALSVGDSVRVGQTTLEVVEQGQDASPAAAAGPPTVASPAAQPQAPPPQSPAAPAEAQTPALQQQPPARARQPDPPQAAPQPQSPPPQPASPAAPPQKAEKEEQKSSNVLAAVGLIGVVVLLVLIIIALG